MSFVVTQLIYDRLVLWLSLKDSIISVISTHLYQFVGQTTLLPTFMKYKKYIKKNFFMTIYNKFLVFNRIFSDATSAIYLIVDDHVTDVTPIGPGLSESDLRSVNDSVLVK